MPERPLPTAQDEVALTEISSRRLFTALPQAVAVAPREELPAKVRFATNAVITDPPRDRFWGGYSGYFADPDGNLWKVASEG